MPEQLRGSAGADFVRLGLLLHGRLLGTCLPGAPGAPGRATCPWDSKHYSPPVHYQGVPGLGNQTTFGGAKTTRFFFLWGQHS